MQFCRAHWCKDVVTLQDELYLKNPAVIACIRGWSLLAEGYRLDVALSLHAIHMVTVQPCIPSVIARTSQLHMLWPSLPFLAS